MAYFVSILLGAVVAATLADLALNRWGRLAMVVIFGLLAVLIWSVSLQHPLLATNSLNGRAFAFSGFALPRMCFSGSRLVL